MGKIKDFVYDYLMEKLLANRTCRFVSNINYDATKRQKRILFIYLDYFVACGSLEMLLGSRTDGAGHTNRLEFFQILKMFIELDCCIDVCSYNDEELKMQVKHKTYDVVFGMGEMFRYAIEHLDAYKVLYMTENPYSISYQKEMERVKYYEERTGKSGSIQRTGLFYKADDEKNVDAIVCLGDTKYFQYLSIPVYAVKPSAFFNTVTIDYQQRKRNSFLVFGTDGIIHKGIDLLVEVFARHPEWDLYVCGSEFTKQVNELGYVLADNIHDCGYIKVQSDKFADLICVCSFIVLPSCSEGTSTAVLTGMRHGLIPVVMHDNGFDRMEEYCIFFEDFHLDVIEQTLAGTQVIPMKELIALQHRIFQYADEVFTLEHFTSEMKKILQKIVDGEGDCR